MPLYEYRPKSGACDICKGRFVDLQKMSDPQHVECPDCGQACERVISAPIVSVRGESYRAASNAENRANNMARANSSNTQLRESTLKKYGQISGHTHNCALSGCFGVVAKDEATNELESSEKAHRIGGLPHLVGVRKN